MDTGTQMEVDDFSRLLAGKGKELYRDMPWRTDTRPYYVLVSELMLQQTQVLRVVPKFNDFITRFPDIASLAVAPLSDVLQLWQGLGYNRRAKFLHDAAKMIMNEFKGKFPVNERELMQLPGVGRNTAGAIMVYAYDEPVLFIETNIRTVYFYHFFNNQQDVSDTQVMEWLRLTIDSRNPRRFYQALMDYGSWLKANGVRNISVSRHYKKQSLLRGSLREMRGVILRSLSDSAADIDHLRATLDDERVDRAIEGLLRDGLVQQSGRQIHLTK